VTITAQIIEAIHERATEISLSSSLHGPRHWRDVACVGLALMTDGAQSDPDVLLAFAASHDTQRQNDGWDPDHGQRAAIIARHLYALGKLPLGLEQLETLRVALMLHDRGEVASDLEDEDDGLDWQTIATCWDADRLTLWRVGTTPDPALLSTETARRDDRDWPAFGKAIVTGGDLAWQAIVDGYLAGAPSDQLFVASAPG
jgi:uncharacterized protein